MSSQWILDDFGLPLAISFSAKPCQTHIQRPTFASAPTCHCPITWIVHKLPFRCCLKYKEARCAVRLRAQKIDISSQPFQLWRRLRTLHHDHEWSANGCGQPYKQQNKTPVNHGQCYRNATLIFVTNLDVLRHPHCDLRYLASKRTVIVSQPQITPGSPAELGQTARNGRSSASFAETLLFLSGGPATATTVQFSQWLGFKQFAQTLLV